jgi:uncharacterized protein (TIGR02147 family)
VKASNLAPHEILKQAFDAKKRARSGTSLRALSERLKCSPAFLSKVLSGKAKVPIEKIEAYAKAFDLDEFARRSLKASLASQRLGPMQIEVKSVEADRRLGSRMLDYEEQRAPRVHEKILGAWYHLAILDLMTCTTFVSEPAWIAEELGLTVFQAETSLKLLEEAGLARQVKGQWTKTNERIKFPSSRSTEAMRQYQKQVISRALQKLAESAAQEDFDRRLITSASLAVNSAKIPEAKARLMQALTEVAEILTDGPCDEVFSIAIQLFPQRPSKARR